MRNLNKLLISSITLIVIGFLGLGITLTAGSAGLRADNFGRSKAYKFEGQGFCNTRNNNIFPSETKNLSFETVKALGQNYIERVGQDLKIAEIMEFSKNFYIEIVEADTGIGAMELLVDKPTGFIFPEYGPNMMWNLKYGMHRRINNADPTVLPIDKQEAIEIAVEYLSRSVLNEYVGEDAEKFYGYYTIHTVDKDGNILGMLSVNGFSGDVWYHDWHGVFINMEEYD